MRSQTSKGPEFVRYLGPVIEALHELGGSGRPAEVRERIAQRLGLSDEARAEAIASGESRFDNQVHWARFYLAKADYLDASRRGVWTLTNKGRAIRGLTPADAMAIFRQVRTGFVNSSGDAQPELLPVTSGAADRTSPDEGILPAGDYRTRLLEVLLSLPADGFERLCQRLLRESGFEQVVVTGRSGDGGIDGHGVLQVNPLVSFKVLFQCKRYKGVVSASQVRDFRGAMMGRADKGIILTTGTFTVDAQKEALRDGVPAIELVHGEKLLDMFENLELGLVPRKTFDIDEEFFDGFRTEDVRSGVMPRPGARSSIIRKSARLESP
jgi:restriction system protein